MAVFSGNGSNGSPSFTFSSDTNTGMYRVGADSIGFSTGSAIAPGYNTTLYLTDRRVLIGTSSTTSEYRFIAQAQFGNTSTGTGQILVASGISSVFDGSSIGAYDIGTSTHVALARFDARGNGTGASPQPVSLRWYNHDGSSLNHNLTLSQSRYLRLESGTGGIQFNGDTAAANALDDYEEGTWTPLVTQVGGTDPTYTASGKYVKIGNFVHCNCDITVTAPGSGGGGQRHISLPFGLGPSGSAATWNCTASYRSISALGIAAPLEENRPLSAYAYENVLFFSTPADTDNGIQLFGTWAVGTLNISFSYLS